MQALTAAAATLGGKYLQECTLYVTVEPCIMCAGAIGWAQVSRVVWGADDPKKGFRRYSEAVFHPRTTVARGVSCATAAWPTLSSRAWRLTDAPGP